MELGPRDRLSQAFVHEVEKGRTLDSEYGPIVHLDLRHLGEKLIDTKLPFVRELCLKYERIDPVTELIPVRPVVHYMMGGVHTDIDGATPIAGLYAAGETACVSINGANRLGSNSLPECLVFGARAGRGGSVVRRERRAGPPPPSPPRPPTRCGASSGSSAPRPATTPSPPSGPRCRRRWRTPPGSTAPGPRWPRGRTGSASCRNARPGSGSGTPAARFNTELVAALELANMLDVAECMLASGLRREESRGAHQRTDFPERDDERFLTHQLVERDRGRLAAGLRAAGDHHPLAAGRTGLREVADGGHHQAAGDAGGGRTRARRRGRRSTTSRCARSGRSSTASTTSRTRSTRPSPSAGRAGWGSAAAAA